MTKGYFDAPVFEIEKCEIDVDISLFQYKNEPERG